MVSFNGWGKVFAAVVFCVLGASGLTATPLVWDGSDSTDWNDANNWTPAQVPTSADDVSIPDAATTNNDPTLPATGACASLTIATSGILNGSTGTLNVGGAWVNNGTFNHGTSTITFDGGANSALSGTGTLNFYLLTVAKSSGSQLFTTTKALAVASNMTLSGGEFINGAFTHVVTGNFLKSGGRLTINGDYSHRLDVNGNFTVTGGDVNFSGFGYIFCAGNADISGNGSFAVANGHSFQMDGSGSHTVSVSGTGNQFWTLAIAGTSSTVQALTDITTNFIYHYRGTLDVNGKNLRLNRGYIGYNTAVLQMASGTFDVGSDGLDGTYFATWTVQSGWGENISGGTITVRGKDYYSVGNVYFYSGSNFTPTGGTFRMIGNDATKTLRIQEATNFNFANLELGDGTNTTTVVLWNNASQQACDVDGTNMLDPIYSVQESQWSARINRVSDRDIHYFDYLVKVPAAQAPTDYLGFVAYDNFEVRIFGDRYEIWNTGGLTPIGGPYPAPGGSTAGFRNIGIQASGVSAIGAANGVYIDGVYAIPSNPPYHGVLPGPDGRFGTHNPPGTSEGTNGCELLDFLSYIKSFNRTLDDAPPGGGGTGPGTENPGEPRTTTTFFDGPMPATVYELANDPAGTTGNPVGFGGGGGAPALGLPYFEVNGDATMISFGRMDGFGSGNPDDRDDQFCLVNGRRGTALTVGSERIIGGDPYFGEGKEPLYTPAVRGVGLTDAVGNFCWGNRTDPLDPRVLDTYGGGAGTATELPYSSIYDVVGIPNLFGANGSPAPDHVTVPNPQAYCTSGGGNASKVESLDGTLQVGPDNCACQNADTSKETAPTKRDPETGNSTTENGGKTADYPLGLALSPGQNFATNFEQAQVGNVAEGQAEKPKKATDDKAAYDAQLARLIGMKLTDEFLASGPDERKDAIVKHMKDKHGADPKEVEGAWAGGTQTWANHSAVAGLGLDDCKILQWVVMFEAGSTQLSDDYRKNVAGAIKNRAANFRKVTGAGKTAKEVGAKGTPTLTEVVLSGKAFSFLNRDDAANSADALRMAEMLGVEKEITDDTWKKYFPDDAKRKNLKEKWENAKRALGDTCDKTTDPDGADHYWVDTVKAPDWHDPKKVTKELPTPIGGKKHTTYFEKLGGDVRVPNKDWKKTEK